MQDSVPVLAFALTRSSGCLFRPTADRAAGAQISAFRLPYYFSALLTKKGKLHNEDGIESPFKLHDDVHSMRP